MTDQKVVITAGAGFGDEGKGHTVDYLVRALGAGLVVRYNGGSQAAHNVVTPDGRHHTYAQFGSGTFVPGVRTLLSKFMLVNPLNMLREEEALRAAGVSDAFSRTFVDGEALMVTPLHAAANRILELYRDKNTARHGSCGAGIGQTMSDSLEFGDAVPRIKDLQDLAKLRKKWDWLRDQKFAKLESLVGPAELAREIYAQSVWLYSNQARERIFEDYALLQTLLNIRDSDFCAELLRSERVSIFEGAQGVLLDQSYGFFPYNTWTDTTFWNAQKLLIASGFSGEVIKLGVLRAYYTRHGAGPFVTEDTGLTDVIPDAHNGNNDWQQNFRVGWFDSVAAKYALEVVGGVDGLALTCLDRLQVLPEVKVCTGYKLSNPSGSISDYFSVNTEGIITGIKVQKPTHNAHQEALTRNLYTVQPILESVGPVQTQKQVAGYIQYLQSLLGVPITLQSHGPSAGHIKTVVPYASAPLA